MPGPLGLVRLLFQHDVLGHQHVVGAGLDALDLIRIDEADRRHAGDVVHATGSISSPFSAERVVQLARALADPVDRMVPDLLAGLLELRILGFEAEALADHDIGHGREQATRERVLSQRYQAISSIRSCCIGVRSRV
jgi:hypothetical protein